jgi:hypothetical protein
MPVVLPSSKSRTVVPGVRDTVPVGDLLPPDPPLAGVQAVLRPFRVGDAAAIAEFLPGSRHTPVHDDAGGDD